MIRLTLILLAAIGITLVVAGRDPADVASVDAPEPTAEPIAPETGTAGPEERSLALDDEAGAIERALAATERHSAAGRTSSPDTEAAAAALGDASAEDAALWYVTGSRVNLRQAPSTSSAVVGQVGRGARAEVLDQTEDGWMRIRVVDSGLTAYIFGRFLDETPAG